MVLGNHSLEVPYSCAYPFPRFLLIQVNWFKFQRFIFFFYSVRCIAVNLLLVSTCLAWNQAYCSFLSNIPERYSSPPACFMKIITNYYISNVFCVPGMKSKMERTKVDGNSSVVNAYSSNLPSTESATSNNVLDIKSQTIAESSQESGHENEINDVDENKQEKVVTRNITSFIETRYPLSTDGNDSWCALFSFFDRLLLLVYFITMLVFHS